MITINYNHLYYFWVVYKEGSVVRASEILHITPQTITMQIKVLEGRFQGKLFTRKGRGIQPSDLGHIVFRYAERMFALSQELLLVLSRAKNAPISFRVGIVDSLSKNFVAEFLQSIIINDENVCLCCSESPINTLLEQLDRYELDVIISDIPVVDTTDRKCSSIKIGESNISFWSSSPISDANFPQCLENHPLLVPSHNSNVGRRLLSWIDSLHLKNNILAEFDDAALMEEFSLMHEAIFAAPKEFIKKKYKNKVFFEVGQVGEVKEEYHVVFPERLIMHPIVERIINLNLEMFPIS